MSCDEIMPLIDLHFYGEASDAEEYELLRHVELCQSCAQRLDEQRRLRQLLQMRPQAQANRATLTRYRAQLSEILDHEDARAGSWIERIWNQLGSPLRWDLLRAAPAFAAALIVLGFGVGWFAGNRSVLQQRYGTGGVGPVSEASLTPVRINSVSRDASGRVLIDFDGMERHVIAGTANDPQVRRMLIYAAEDRPNPGIRLDSLDVLRSNIADLQVRRVLLWTLQHDPNPGVRLKALESLRTIVPDDPEVRQALVRTVLQDAVPGLRTEAIDALTQGPPDATRQLLVQVAHRTEDPSVRIRCAAAMKQMQMEIPADLFSPDQPASTQ